MKKYFDFYKQEPLMVERESLHREVQKMLDEQNLPECQRAYLQLIEDLYESVRAFSTIYDCTKELDFVLSSDILQLVQKQAENGELLLEKWERHLLRDSLCSGESCL